jgi:hypothetical protein
VEGGVGRAVLLGRDVGRGVEEDGRVAPLLGISTG